MNVENQVQGGVVLGLGRAISSGIICSEGMADQTNYHASDGMRLSQTPRIHVETLSNIPDIRGIGEPPVPPAAPALASAIFVATGHRLQEMQFQNFIEFL
jgi:isoquinoline 1-oxidoreductase beta subunit